MVAMAGVANGRGSAEDKHNRGLASRVIGAVVGPLVTPVVDHVDVDGVVGRIDIDEVLQRIDLDDLTNRIDLEALLDRIDPERLVDRIDLNRLVDRLDLNGVLDRVDLNGVLDRVDLNLVLDRVDLNRLLTRVDLDAAIARVDLNRVIDRVDLDAAVDHVDINRVLERVDTDALIERTEIGALIARSTGDVATRVLDMARAWGVTLDVVTHGVVDRMLRRKPDAPPLEETAAESVPAAGPTLSPGQLAAKRDVELQGHHAGMISRFVAFLVDAFLAYSLYVVGAGLFGLAYSVLSGKTLSITDHRLDNAVVFAIWAFLYLSVPLAAVGRTVGQAVLGLKVVRGDGMALGWWHAAVRTLVFLLSLVVFPLIFLVGLLRRDRRCVHDLAAGTVVIYQWDARTAGLRFLADRAGPGSAPGRA